MKNATYTINGHTVVAQFAVEDARTGDYPVEADRQAEEECREMDESDLRLDAVQVIATLSIDGKGKYEILLQNDGDGSLMIEYGTFELHDAAARAAFIALQPDGFEISEEFDDIDEWLDSFDWISEMISVLDPVSTDAQAAFNDYINQE